MVPRSGPLRSFRPTHSCYSPRVTLVLGIDPSLTATALASAGDAGLRHVLIRTTPAQPLPLRLRRIADSVYAAVKNWPGGPPDLVVVETPGFIQRHGGMEGVYRAQGAILAGLPAGLRVELVGVARWRNGLGIKVPRGAGKQPFVDFALALGAGLPRSPRAGRPDGDCADAYCLAEWGLRILRAERTVQTVAGSATDAA